MVEKVEAPVGDEMTQEEVRAPFWEIPVDQVPWMLLYLREDIQDLREDMREIRRSIEHLAGKIDRCIRR